MRNYFTLDGVDSRDFGVYISGQGTFSAPARSYDMISIPGRSGDLYKDNNRLENGVFTYPAFICRNFKQNIADFRAFLLSLRGYHRLVDSYHPNEYRMVSFQGEFDPDVTAKNDAASFDITFNCKPQRFLLSGEEVVTLDVNDPPSETFSGNPATFEADGEYPITGLSVAVEPIQDLHGFANPWPAGGGKNKLAFPYFESSKTNNGVTFTVNDDGTVRINGTATARGVFYLQAADSNFHPDAGTYYASKGSESQSATIIVEAYSGATWKKNLASLGTAASVQFTVDYDGYDRVVAYISVSSGNSPSNEIVKPMFRLSSVSDDTFAPYSNICPISGWTECKVTRTGKNLLPNVSGERSECSIYIGQADGTTYPTHLKAGVTYALSFTTNLSQAFAYMKENSGSNISLGISGSTYTPTSDMDVQIWVYNTGLTSVSDFQLEVGNTATAYENYRGNTYSISWQSKAGTVYGGTLDVTTGKLTVEYVKKTISSFRGAFGTVAKGYAAYVTDAETDHQNVSKPSYMVSNIFKYTNESRNDANVFEYGGSDGGSSTQVFILPSTITSVAEANAWLSSLGTPLECTFKLATPIVYDLTPTEVSTLLGTNNVWSDAGAVEGKYVLPFTIENPTRFNSQPLLRVYGAGNLGINGDTITISQADVYTDIDCEMMDAFKGAENRNQYITLANYKFPVLVPGENNFSLGAGITRVEITPRWWTV